MGVESREQALRKALDRCESVNADLLAALKEIRGWFIPYSKDGLAGALGRADAAITRATGTETTDA